MLEIIKQGLDKEFILNYLTGQRSANLDLCGFEKFYLLQICHAYTCSSLTSVKAICSLNLQKSYFMNSMKVIHVTLRC